MSSVSGVHMAGDVELSIAEDVACLLLRRSERLNALTPHMLHRLGQHLDTISASSARVVVLRGEGQKAFCVGADIECFAELSPLLIWREWTVLGHSIFSALATLRQPTIAVLHGLALGGGLELALACDFRVVAEQARLALPEVALGTVPGWGGTERLTDVVGRPRAKEVILAGRQLDGHTAEAWGLANACVPGEQLDAAVEELVGRLASGAPVAIQIGKQLIDAAADGASSHLLESLAGAVTVATDDLGAGVAAFRSRSTPHFSGS